METRNTGAMEGEFTGALESRTSKIPSGGYLAAAVASMATSALLKMFGKNHAALFVGQWAPAFLIMGVYNKMVKQHGSDGMNRNSNRQNAEENLPSNASVASI